MSNVKSGFYIESAGRPDDIRRRMRPMADLIGVMADLTEIEARQPTSTPEQPVAPGIKAINAKAVWDNYRQNKGTPMAAHR